MNDSEVWRDLFAKQYNTYTRQTFFRCLNKKGDKEKLGFISVGDSSGCLSDYL